MELHYKGLSDPVTRRQRERRLKVNLRSLSLYRNHFFPLTLSNVGVEFLRTIQTLRLRFLAFPASRERKEVT